MKKWACSTSLMRFGQGDLSAYGTLIRIFLLFVALLCSSADLLHAMPPIDSSITAKNVYLGMRYVVPYYFQDTTNDCGASSAAMVAQWWGEQELPNILTTMRNSACVGTNITLPSSIVAGFSNTACFPTICQTVYNSAGMNRTTTELVDTDPAAIKNWLRRGIPVIVLQYANPADLSMFEGHWRVVVGFDDNLGEFYVNDPSTWINGSAEPGQAMSYTNFDKCWNYITFWGMSFGARTGIAVYPGNGVLTAPQTLVSQSGQDLSVSLKNPGTEGAKAGGAFLRASGATFENLVNVPSGQWSGYAAYDALGNPATVFNGASMFDSFARPVAGMQQPAFSVGVRPANTSTATVYYGGWLEDADDVVHCSSHTTVVHDYMPGGKTVEQARGRVRISDHDDHPFRSMVTSCFGAWLPVISV